MIQTKKQNPSPESYSSTIARTNLTCRIELFKESQKSTSLQKEIYDRCSSDLIFYFNYWLWTYNPKVPPYHFPFVLFDCQVPLALALDKEIEDGNGSITEKSRDVGATFIALAVYLRRWLFRSDFEALLISLKEEEVDNPSVSSLFGKLRYMAYHLPGFLMPLGFIPRLHGDPFKRFINPENGNTILGAATTEDTGRSSRKSVILVDEYASIGSRLISGLEKSLQEATNTIHRISTPKGINQFKKLRDRGTFPVHTIHWTEIPTKRKGLYYFDENGKRNDCPDLPPGRINKYGFLKDEKGDKTKIRLRSPWYDGKCQDAVSLRDVAQELDINYLGSGNCRFTDSMIEDGSKNCRQGKRGYLKEINGQIIFIESDPGANFELEVWKFPTQPYYNHRTFIGEDTAEGLEKGDYSSADVIEKQVPSEICQHVAHLHGHWAPDVFADKSDMLGRWYDDSGSLLIIERNKDGLGVLLRLRNVLGFVNLYCDEYSKAGNIEKRLGFLTTAAKKFTVTGDLDEALRSGELSTGSLEHFAEMSTFINNEGKLGATGDNYDDRVISLCLAWHGAKQSPRATEKLIKSELVEIPRLDTSRF